MWSRISAHAARRSRFKRYRAGRDAHHTDYAEMACDTIEVDA